MPGVHASPSRLGGVESLIEHPGDHDATRAWARERRARARHPAGRLHPAVRRHRGRPSDLQADLETAPFTRHGSHGEKRNRNRQRRPPRGSARRPKRVASAENRRRGAESPFRSRRRKPSAEEVGETRTRRRRRRRRGPPGPVLRSLRSVIYSGSTISTQATAPFLHRGPRTRGRTSINRSTSVFRFGRGPGARAPPRYLEDPSGCRLGRPGRVLGASNDITRVVDRHMLANGGSAIVVRRRMSAVGFTTAIVRRFRAANSRRLDSRAPEPRPLQTIRWGGARPVADPDAREGVSGERPRGESDSRRPDRRRPRARRFQIAIPVCRSARALAQTASIDRARDRDSDRPAGRDQNTGGPCRDRGLEARTRGMAEQLLGRRAAWPRALRTARGSAAAVGLAVGTGHEQCGGGFHGRRCSDVAAAARVAASIGDFFFDPARAFSRIDRIAWAITSSEARRGTAGSQNRRDSAGAARGGGD